MEKISILNRKGQHVMVLVDVREASKGLAFVMHGLGGFKEQDHIAAVAHALSAQGFTVVRFDTTNSIGESDGRYEDATTTNYYEDLEDVIEWSKTQPWYQEPFILSGHSLGGISAALYAQKHPESVRALVPLSPVVSGTLRMEANKKYRPEDTAEWERTGWRETESKSKPGVVKRLPWSHFVDCLQYDLLPGADKLTMPVLLIVGENDTTTPPEQTQILCQALPGAKELHVIAGASHTFRDPHHLAQIQQIISDWAQKV
ncbi:MAG TPA: alpha/beta fold hydrolase [Candidatus Paceibacterota bacterium]